MKIHHSPAYCLLLSFFLLIGCTDDPSPPTSKDQPDTDTSDQQLPFDEQDAADLNELLKQYNPPGRDVWQKPEKVIDKMGDLSEKVVADLGAGSGDFFTFRLAQHAKKVIALEIDQQLIDLIDSAKMLQLKPEYQDRLETRLVEPNDSKLQPGEADIILIVNTFIYIKDRVNYLMHLRDVLPEGGQVIIVDFKKKRIPIKNPKQHFRVELYQVENELFEAGFNLKESDDCSLDYQYIVVAEK